MMTTRSNLSRYTFMYDIASTKSFCKKQTYFLDAVKFAMDLFLLSFLRVKIRLTFNLKKNNIYMS